MPYKLIDHTADIGIEVTEPTIKDLFEMAAAAMFEQITDISKLDGARKKSIHVKGIDQTDLLINCLRELLWCWTIDNCLISHIVVTEMANNYIRAKISYDEFHPQKHEILKDIKAVTYHGATVEQVENGWVATVIFDV